VFASALILTITIERSGEAESPPAIHLHPGGQGFWVARMIARLGVEPILSAPVGGETGQVLRSLLDDSAMEAVLAPIQSDSPSYIHDRRNGERVEIVETPAPSLTRHELDDFYSKTLEAAVASGICVVTGRVTGGGVPDDVYQRLGADLQAMGIPAIADMHGDDLGAYLKGGELDLLKVSREDLEADGVLESDSEAAIWAAVERLLARGAKAVVVSGAEGGSLAATDEERFRVSQPRLEAVDPRGSGDSMTAGLAVAMVNQQDLAGGLKLASAAGAANVVRHGLGNADAELIAGLVDQIEVESWRAS
jgi:1-phosphofructokinase